MMCVFSQPGSKNLLQVLLSEVFFFWLRDKCAAMGKAPGMSVIPPLSEFLASPHENKIKLLITEALSSGILLIQSSLP